MARVPAFDEIYNDEQRDSIAVAVVEGRQGVKVARDAMQLAARGELVSVKTGETLAAFTMPITTVRKLAGDERKRRTGNDVPAWIRDKGTDEAVTELGLRLTAIAYHEITHIERQKPGKRDLDKARKAGQILREARALDRGDAPKQGSAQRRARAGERPDGTDAASGAAALVHELRSVKQGEGPQANGQGPEQGDTETDRPTTHAHEQGEADEAGMNGETSEAQTREARERMRAELGIQAEQSQ